MMRVGTVKDGEPLLLGEPDFAERAAWLMPRFQQAAASSASAALLALRSNRPCAPSRMNSWARMICSSIGIVLEN